MVRAERTAHSRCSVRCGYDAVCSPTLEMREEVRPGFLSVSRARSSLGSGVPNSRSSQRAVDPKGLQVLETVA